MSEAMRRAADVTWKKGFPYLAVCLILAWVWVSLLTVASASQ